MFSEQAAKTKRKSVFRKELNCEICGISCKGTSNLNKHMKRHASTNTGNIQTFDPIPAELNDDQNIIVIEIPTTVATSTVTSDMDVNKTLDLVKFDDYPIFMEIPETPETPADPLETTALTEMDCALIIETLDQIPAKLNDSQNVVLIETPEISEVTSTDTGHMDYIPIDQTLDLMPANLEDYPNNVFMETPETPTDPIKPTALKKFKRKLPVLPRIPKLKKLDDNGKESPIFKLVEPFG